jgi:endonuclease/exonuclease/phosphatase family metal-dependent hydrolase
MENLNVARMLAQVLGYDDVRISEGPDRRGIDVAVMWKNDKVRFVQAAQVEVPQLHTRPIFKVLFAVRSSHGMHAGGKLVVYGNHWPAQMSPPQHRMIAAQTLAKTIEDDMNTFKGDYYGIAMGDFNQTEQDSPNGCKDVVLSPQWNHHLVDVQQLSDQSNNPMKGHMPPGSYFYDQWNRFDKILVTQNLVDGSSMDVEPETFRVVAADYLLTNQQGVLRPIRYNFFANSPAEAGHSDHLPVVVKLHLPD